MTHQEKIDYIRGECIKANKHLLDLTFGCEVETFGSGRTDILLSGVLNDITTSDNVDMEDYDYCKSLYNKRLYIKPQKGVINIGKIIGHTITLASIINTIVKNQEKTLVPYTLSVAYFVKKWNLTQDDLSQQENETIDYLYQILGGK